jgi:hypothetical protein
MSNQDSENANTLYPSIARELEAAVITLPVGTLTERFHHAMSSNLDYVVSHRDTLRAMVIAGFSGTLENVETSIASHAQITAAFTVLVNDASDTLPPAQVGQMAVLLTNVHLLLMLFLLHDRTEGNKASFDLLAFTCDAFSLIRPLLMIPPGAKALARLSSILVTALAGGWGNNT